MKRKPPLKNSWSVSDDCVSESSLGGGGEEEKEVRRDKKLTGRSFGVRVERRRRMRRKMSRTVGTVWDLSFPESDSCCASHGGP